ncbi:hypothetical protein GCM10027592_29260 [Spirosoma flavus]
MKHYTYLGDRMTDPTLKGQLCTAVLRDDGKCIRGKNGSMLVRFENGRVAVVIGRLLRKVK